jgi:hypothetical protein
MCLARRFSAGWEMPKTQKVVLFILRYRANVRGLSRVMFRSTATKLLVPTTGSGLERARPGLPS